MRTIARIITNVLLDLLLSALLLTAGGLAVLGFIWLVRAAPVEITLLVGFALCVAIAGLMTYIFHAEQA